MKADSILFDHGLCVIIETLGAKEKQLTAANTEVDKQFHFNLQIASENKSFRALLEDERQSYNAQKSHIEVLEEENKNLKASNWMPYKDFPLPILRGAYLVYGTINKETEHEIRSKFFAYWQGDVFTDKDGEDLTGINDSVEYWFDHSLIPDPV